METESVGGCGCAGALETEELLITLGVWLNHVLTDKVKCRAIASNAHSLERLRQLNRDTQRHLRRMAKARGGVT